MSFPKKIIQLILILVAVLLISYILKKVFIHNEPEDEELLRPVKSQIISKEENGLEATFIGRIDALKTADLSFKTSGILSRFDLKNGQEVNKGDFLAKLDSQTLIDNLNSLQAQYNKANADAKRYENLYPGGVSLSDVESYRTSADVALASLNIAKKTLKDATMRAPFSGLISKTYVDVDETLAAGQPIATLQNLDVIQISIDIPQRYVALQSNDNIQATAIFDASPQKSYTLTKNEFSTEINTQTQTYEVKFSLEHPEGLLLYSGMTADVTLKVVDPLASNTLFVPVAALVYNPDTAQESVWILDTETNTVHLQNVKANRIQDDQVEITEGIIDGDRVVTAGVTLLHEGQEVLLWHEPVESILE